VFLLYGRQSKAAELAQAAQGNLAVITDLLVLSETPAGLDYVGRIREHHHKALKMLEDFTEAAAAQVRGTRAKLFGISF
jgi:hypothetical protein